jgi:S-adenosylmethionine synthetase
MFMVEKYSNMRVREETRRKIRILAALVGMSLIDYLETIIDEEYVEIQVEDFARQNEERG